MYFMSNTKKSILLVGGGGYLGFHLGETISKFYTVFYTSKRKKENTLLIDFLDSTTFENIKGKEYYDYIIILASSLKGLGTRDLDEENLIVDAIGLPKFLQFIKENKLGKKFMYISSMTVYGI